MSDKCNFYGYNYVTGFDGQCEEVAEVEIVCKDMKTVRCDKHIQAAVGQFHSKFGAGANIMMRNLFGGDKEYKEIKPMKVKNS